MPSESVQLRRANALLLAYHVGLIDLTEADKRAIGQALKHKLKVEAVGC